ncbi:MAG: DUF1622 domain-containing protein [Oscillospiraceae bacterium]|nr:DUF1622 domain-containing protein [Oscillospiraceae bacterium]
MGIITELLHLVIEWAIKGFEVVGVIVIIMSGIRGLLHYVRRDTHTQVVLFKGLSMGLGFALGGEILHTFVARDLKDVALVGGIIALRVALTFLMHWEMKVESEEEEMHEQEYEEKEEK